MGFWADLRQQRREERLREERERQEELRALNEAVMAPIEELNKLIAPGGLDDFSDTEITHLHLTTESEAEKLVSEITGAADNIKNASGDGGLLKAVVLWGVVANAKSAEEILRKKQLLLKLIEAKQKERTLARQQPAATAVTPTREEKRASSQERIRKLQRDKGEDLERMRLDGDDEESILRRSNMWDDAIMREEEELRKWL